MAIRIRSRPDEQPPEGPGEGSRRLAAFLVTLCGGLALLFLAFALIAGVSLAEAIGFAVAIVALAAVWLVGAWQRSRSGAQFVTRRERERRGF